MVNIEQWVKNFNEQIHKRFRERVWFVGLQGSYARGEATDESDIDVVVILDELSASDIQLYNRILDELPHFCPVERSCRSGLRPTCSSFTTIPYRLRDVWMSCWRRSTMQLSKELSK